MEGEYQTRFKEKLYKGRRTQPRCPSWCDRLLYTDAELSRTGDAVADADRLHIRPEGGASVDDPGAPAVRNHVQIPAC